MDLNGASGGLAAFPSPMLNELWKSIAAASSLLRRSTPIVAFLSAGAL
jgi:hypothetical protein